MNFTAMDEMIKNVVDVVFYSKYYYITDQSAFDFNREEILEQNNIYIEGEKHNSLYDAKVIREIHKIVSR